MSDDIKLQVEYDKGFDEGYTRGYRKALNDVEAHIDEAINHLKRISRTETEKK